MSLGAETDRIPAPRCNGVLVRRRNRQVLTVRLNTRAGSTWQSTTNEGDPDSIRDHRRFVDLANRGPAYYVFAEWWFQMDVHRNYSEYMARWPGLRTSTHHAL
jgi:hypothetical protein